MRIYALLTAILIGLPASHCLFAQNIVFNEYMTANSSVIADEDGKYPDWLELYNNSVDPASLTGWSMSDHPADSLPWIIPSIRLEPFQHIIFFASGKDKGHLAPYNESVVQPGDDCRYLLPVSEPEVGWFWPDIDDSGWLRGRLSLGYGDGDDTTEVPATTSLYVRMDFQVESIENLEYAILHIDYDDGFVAYVNGAEIARSNVSGYPPAFDATAIEDREAVMFSGGKPEMFFLPAIADLVRNGRNVLAIQLHNSDPASTDLSIIPFLTLGLNIEPVSPRGVATPIDGFLLQMHTNFKLAADNDTLILRDNNGLVIDQTVIEDIPGGMSRGRAPDGSANWRIFDAPTPGEANPFTGGTYVTPRPLMTPVAGFYSSSVTVSMSNDSAQALIYYTLDGSPPNDSSLLYTGPFRLDTSYVVRAMARIPGELASPDRVSSFIIGHQHTLPVFSLSTDPFHLWDHESGIYVLGPSYEPESPYRGANFWQNWERPIHVEMFETDGLEAVELDAGIKIHGGWTRSFPQKSLRILARAKYGQGSINYQMFPELGIDQFESIILRNGGSDWDHTIFRDGLLTGLMKDAYPYISAYRPAIVYINGAYWGIQNIREQMNEDYVAAHLDVDPEEVDAFEIWGEMVSGEWDAYHELVDFFETHDLSSSTNYAAVQELIDVEEFIIYNAVHIYVDNGDWPGNNNRFFKVRRPGEKWHWWLMDLDFGFGLHGDNSWEHNSLADALSATGTEWPNPAYATLFLRRMCESPVFRAKFINGMADLMNFQYAPANVLQQMNEKKGALLPEIDRHLRRWDRDLAEWQEKVDELPPFAQNRPAFMRQFIEQQFSLPGHATITLNSSPPAGGDVLINGKKINPVGWNGVYFRTVPLVVEAIPQPGYRFVGWTGGSASTNPRLTVSLDNDRSITALFSLAPGLVGLPVINEINYNSADTFDVGDWVEILAFGGEVDLSNWSLSDEDSAHVFVFPMGTVIPSDGFLVVAVDTARFDSFFPGSVGVIGNLGFGFGAGGDQVRLISPRGDTIDSVEYDDEAPWPLEADGLGATLELLDPALPNDDPLSWRASLYQYGSPVLGNQYNPPGAFSLAFPTDGWVAHSDSVLVGWNVAIDNDPGDTVSYTVEWSLRSEFDTLFSAITIDTTLRLSGLADRSKIFWRVRADDTQGFRQVAAPGDSGRSFKILLTPVPETFDLQPVFPNPFNSFVWITVDVPVDGEIELVFYDLLGRQIYAIRETFGAGSNRVRFPPEKETDLASGIYWVVAKMGDKTKIAKLALVR